MAITSPAKKILTKEKPKIKQRWMTDKILLLMDNRRIMKGKNEQRYKQIQKEIKKEIRIAKEDFYKRKCEEIEQLQAKHDIFNVHKK